MTSTPYPTGQEGGLVDTVPSIHVAGTGGDVGIWGMWGLMATEGALFAYLITAYLYLQQGHTAWPPPPHGIPELGIALPNTFILLGSSVAAWYGERGASRGSRGALISGIATAIVLGLIFLVLQGVEYSQQQFTLRTDAYGSAFFTITGFHGAHVLAGVLALSHTLIRAFLGHFGEGRYMAVTNSVRYWHLVDAVWLVVFTSLYLSPRW